ncbi:MAG: DUF971 domain-containing protein [Chloroflexi bacterium]|nr:DUF971 domain-containing protein [Chloroflexota bacterium]
MNEPARVEIKPEGIAIVWDDGHISLYAHKYLRINCACAGCIEEWTKRQLLDPITVPADIQAVDYMEVGRYALQFLWSDTHYTGIYPYETLRALCPCAECKAAGSKKG